MAYVGLDHPVFAAITSYTEGSAISYATGKELGQAVTANTNWNRSAAKLYANNKLRESDNSLVGGTIALVVDDVALDIRKDLLGLVSTTSGSSTVYETTGAPSPFVGFGVYRNTCVGGTSKFQARWYHKVQFSLGAEDASTKGESTEFGTTNLDGEIIGVVTDNTGTVRFCEDQEFATAAAAISWLNSKAGITG